MGAFCTCSRTSRFPISDGFVDAFGGGKRPRVTIAVKARSWKSSVSIMRGRCSLGISNANRQAAEVADPGRGRSRCGITTPRPRL
jgi:hypothetical protein